jgi:pseudaminic acid synthase
MKIGKIKIGLNNKPCIIAEISGNHNKKLKNALKLVEVAAESGADMVKLQTYTPDTITLKSSKNEFLIKDKKSLWKNQNLYNLFKKGFTPWEWHPAILKKAKKLGILCFSSVFDETSVDFLEKLDVPAYKIASFESNHYPLIKKVIKTKKPMIISTGLSSLKEIRELVKFLKRNKCNNFALLKCTSAYPANPTDSNVNTIEDMRKKFKCEIGLSDHTLGIGASIAAVSNKATIIEKHITLNRNANGVDDKFSLEPYELKALVKESHTAWQALGKVFYGPTKNEVNSLQFRRSIYCSKDIKKGEKFTKSNIKIIRPSMGLEPKFFNDILGKKAKKNLKFATPVKWSYVKKN